MSILVKGMAMPERCDECPIRQINLARCQVTRKSTSHHPTGKPMNQKERPKWCPLVEVPEDCETCKYEHRSWAFHICDECTNTTSNWEPKWERTE